MKYILPYVTFIFFMLNPCSVSLQDNSQELMQVQIQTHESNAQLFTIFPAHPHTLTYRFTQFQSNKQKMSTTIDNLPAVVFAYAGTSDVKLDAIDATTGKVVLSATQKNIVIETAALQFELKLLSEGDGDVEITLAHGKSWRY